MYQIIEPVTLAARLGAPAAPLIFDLCTDEDHAADPRLIPTARRARHTEMTRATLPADAGHEVVLVCQKGLKLSQGAAARLHAEGCHATILSGGMLGWHAAGLPATHATALPENGLWVIAADPDRDAATAHWLLARFAPPGTRLLTVAPDSRDAVADRFAARRATDPTTLLAVLGLDATCLAPLVAVATAASMSPLDLPALLATAVRDPAAGQPGAPALALLDAALATLRPETGL